MGKKRTNKGQSLVEYVLILAVVVTIVMIAALTRFGSTVSNTYNDIRNAIPEDDGAS